MASSARIDELRKKFDENPRRYFAPLANEYRKAGNLEQAIFICQEYLPQQPGHMSGHIVYGQALFELSRFDEARAVFETALSLDPENLIALRHLGDISRQAGDIRGARAWYQRVLEADPRNEEIAQIMLTVLTTPHDSQPAVPSEATPVGAESVAGASALEPTAVQGSDTAEFPVEKSEDRSGLAVAPELSQLAERQPEPEPIAPSSETIPDEELLDLNDFSVGDTALSSFATPQAEPRPAQPFVPASPTFDSFSELAELQDAVTAEMPIERSEDARSFEADPYAKASAPEAIVQSDEPPPLPLEVFAADTRLGLPDDGGAPSLSDAHDSPVLDGLQSFSEPAFGLSGAEPAPAMHVESFFATPTEAPRASETYEPLAEQAAESMWAPAVDLPLDSPETFSAGHPAEPVPEIEPAVDSGAASEAVEEAGEVAFVTETMAEVYLQQGHLEAALDIYQKLAEQRPGDELLRERMLAVADAIHDASAATAQSDVQSAAYAPYDDGANDVALEGREDDAALGPTIREFLSGILQPRSFVAAQDLIERESTPLSTAALDATLFDDSIFDTSAYGDAPSLGETAMYPTPVSGLTPAYGGTPAHPATPADKPTLGYGLESLQDAPLADAGPTDAAAVKGPTFEEAPQEAATLEIDLSSADFASPESAAASTDSLASIDEEFGADSNDWPQNGAGVESAALEPSDAVEQPGEPVSAAPPAASRPTPSSLATVGGSIDALFSGADASSVDSTAASTLAQAFASEGPETPPLQGMPARRAPDELSLDHVFKSNSAPRPESEGEGFSFDQFFADDMSDAAPKPGAEPTSSAGQGTDDIAQFNSWLNGLKKT